MVIGILYLCVYSTLMSVFLLAFEARFIIFYPGINIYVFQAIVLLCQTTQGLSLFFLGGWIFHCPSELKVTTFSISPLIKNRPLWQSIQVDIMISPSMRCFFFTKGTMFDINSSFPTLRFKCRVLPCNLIQRSQD